jgi:hypothetical protein
MLYQIARTEQVAFTNTDGANKSQVMTSALSSCNENVYAVSRVLLALARQSERRRRRRRPRRLLLLELGPRADDESDGQTPCPSVFSKPAGSARHTGASSSRSALASSLSSPSRAGRIRRSLGCRTSQVSGACLEWISLAYAMSFVTAPPSHVPLPVPGPLSHDTLPMAHMACPSSHYIPASHAPWPVFRVPCSVFRVPYPLPLVPSP